MKTIDVKKLEIISISEVPPPTWNRESIWDPVFESVPKGKALIIDKETRHPTTVRTALHERQKKGKFLNLVIRTRGDKAFIIHPEK